jgi:CRISPR-associated endoribonuclease Cas6
MRIHLKIKTPKQGIPILHQPLLTGTIHKWIGENNNVHGELALFSYSWLTGGRLKNGLLQFNNEGYFFISSHSDKLLAEIIKGIQADPTMFNGLEVKEVLIESNPDFSHINHFNVASPIFIKRRNETSIQHILYTNPLAGQYLAETLQNKMEKVGLTDDALKIEFDLSYSKASTKLVHYNGIDNKTSWCPVIIEGKPETKAFAWNVGLGNSTGIGLGAIK